MRIICFFKRYSFVLLSFIIAGILFSRRCFGGEVSQKSIDRSMILLNIHHKPTENLKELLKLFNAPLKNLSEIIAYTQREWLRKPGQERWQQEEYYEEQREQLLALFNKLEMVNSIDPIDSQHSSYKYGLILGGTLDRMRQRLGYFKLLYDKGLRVDSLVLLGGKRPLDKDKENEARLLDSDNLYLPIKKGWKLKSDLPTTELEMMRMVVDQTDLEDEFLKKVVFIDTPMQKAADGKEQRPTTADTIKEWLLTDPQPGSCVCISSQPFIGYQDSVIRTYLPESFTIETVGPKMENDITIATCLDNIARWLYQENIRRKLKE